MDESKSQVFRCYVRKRPGFDVEAQGLGYGGQLLCFAAARCPRPTLWVLSSNQFAYDWYCREGFRPTGAEKPLSGGLLERELRRE